MIMLARKKLHQYCLRATRRTLVLVALGLFISSCARIMAPEGGPKDTIPPKLIRAFPTQESTGFKEKTIKLVFDKEIEVHDIYNKLVVTPKLPTLKNRPSYTCSVRGKTLKLTLETPLQEETTYTFNFNDAIKDTTEGNIAEGLVLTFCTGEYIDTMYVTGQVKHLMTHEPAAKVLVALCKVSNNSLNIFDNPPDYCAKTDEGGKFKLGHVKKGKYYIYASTSKNNQLTVDPSEDAYGFLSNAIDLTITPLEGVTLSILKADVREFKLQSQQPQGQYFELNFNKPVVDYTLTLGSSFKKFTEPPTLYSHLIEDKQVIRVYNTFGLLEGDRLEAYLTAKDAAGMVLEEKITIQFRASRSQNHPAAYAFEPATGTAIPPDFVGTMTVNKPMKEVIADRLSFIFDNKKEIRIHAEDLQLNPQRDMITITKQLPSMLQWRENGEEDKKESLVLQMKEGAFVTAEGDSSKAMRYVYTLSNPKEYGTIRGTITTEAPGFIVQLLDLKYNVIDSLKNEYNYQFNGIAPGNYKLRLLILQEKEGEWRFGNIHERKEPDPVVLYPADVAVISNWKVEGIDFFF
jgi:Bacterial Ig-like domain